MNMLAVAFPVLGNRCNVLVDSCQMLLDPVIMQLDVRAGRIMLHGGQHLGAVIRHQLADDGNFLQRQNATFVELGHLAIRMRHAPRTKQGNDGQGRQHDAKPRHHLGLQGEIGEQLATALDDCAVGNTQATRPLFAEQAIGLVRRANLLGGCLAAYRHVAIDIATGVTGWRGGCQYPVVIAILAAILDQAGPWTPALRSRHKSSKASTGMSGWRTMLWGSPISSAS
jgi:hypothetical protein